MIQTLSSLLTVGIKHHQRKTYTFEYLTKWPIKPMHRIQLPQFPFVHVPVVVCVYCFTFTTVFLFTNVTWTIWLFFSKQTLKRGFVTHITTFKTRNKDTQPGDSMWAYVIYNLHGAYNNTLLWTKSTSNSQ